MHWASISQNTFQQQLPCAEGRFYVFVNLDPFKTFGIGRCRYMQFFSKDRHMHYIAQVNKFAHS